MKGTADSHIAIKGHGQQDRRFHEGESVEEEELGKAGLKANFPNVEPEELHDCGQGGEGEAQVSQCQHGEKQVHGLVETRLCVDDCEDGGIAHDGDGVEAEEGDGDPDVRVLKSRDSREDEVEGILSGVTHFRHIW